METFSASLALCAANSPASDAELWCFLRLNKRLSKHWWGWWFETPSGPLWRHCNENMSYICMLWHGAYFSHGAQQCVRWTFSQSLNSLYLCSYTKILICGTNVRCPKGTSGMTKCTVSTPRPSKTQDMILWTNAKLVGCPALSLHSNNTWYPQREHFHITRAAAN